MTAPAKPVEMTIGPAPCPTCGDSCTLVGIGSASGRPRYYCLKCGPWTGKNPAAATAGRKGGLASANGLTNKEKSERAQTASDKCWRDDKLSHNVKPGKT